jgi:hypothetical protein
MNVLPNEVRLQELIKYLPGEDIIRLCQTNNEFSKICQHGNIY